jgi:hypothetical protein
MTNTSVAPTTPTAPAPIACKLIGREFTQRKEAITHELFRHTEEITELDDGFAFRFPAFDPWATRILAFIAEERQCCPFFRFELIVEPDDGQVLLRLRGSDEVKAFVLGELGIDYDLGQSNG